jgi:hypothetical protein
MRFVAASLFCLIPWTAAQAEIAIGYTAEWLAHQSELIAVGKPVEVEDLKGPGEITFTRCRFRLTEVVKGAVSAGDQVTIFDYNYSGPVRTDTPEFAKAKKLEKSFLIFAKTSEHLFPEIDGKFVLTNAHDLKSAYMTDQPVARLFTPEFKLLRKYDELLERAREQAKAEDTRKREYWQGKVVRKSLEVEPGTEIYDLLYGGSAVYLWYPEFVPNQAAEPAKK